MQPKEILYVAFGAVVLTNVSIVGTLMATGQIGGEEPLSEQEEVAEEGLEAEALPPEPEPVSRVNYLHTLADAMYLCEERLIASNEGLLKSYSFDHKASRHMGEQDIYFVFIEMETVGSLEEPSETGDIYCEVSPESKSIVKYQMVMREE